MTPLNENIPILMAEDDEWDRLLTRKAMDKNRFRIPW